MSRQYVRIRSWHVVRTPTRLFNTYLTLCGRRVTAMSVDISDNLPGDERTCERCAVLAVRTAQ